MDDNNLSELASAPPGVIPLWATFCDIVTSWNLQFLSLVLNNLNRLSEAQYADLCRAVKTSGIPKAKMHLNALSHNQLGSVRQTLRYNFMYPFSDAQREKKKP